MLFVLSDCPTVLFPNLVVQRIGNKRWKSFSVGLLSKTLFHEICKSANKNNDCGQCPSQVELPSGFLWRYKSSRPRALDTFIALLRVHGLLCVCVSDALPIKGLSYVMYKGSVTGTWSIHHSDTSRSSYRDFISSLSVDNSINIRDLPLGSGTLCSGISLLENQSSSMLQAVRRCLWSLLRLQRSLDKAC